MIYKVFSLWTKKKFSLFPWFNRQKSVFKLFCLFSTPFFQVMKKKCHARNGDKNGKTKINYPTGYLISALYFHRSGWVKEIQWLTLAWNSYVLRGWKFATFIFLCIGRKSCTKLKFVDFLSFHFVPKYGYVSRLRAGFDNDNYYNQVIKNKSWYSSIFRNALSSFRFVFSIQNKLIGAFSVWIDLILFVKSVFCWNVRLLNNWNRSINSTWSLKWNNECSSCQLLTSRLLIFHV